MALITAMTQLDMALLEMFRHSHHLDRLSRSCLDYLVVAAQAKVVDFLISYHRQCGHFLTVFDMLTVGAVTDFAGNGFMNACPVYLPDRFVTGVAGVIGRKLNRNVFLILDIRPPIMPKLSHTLRDEYFPGNEASHHDNDESYYQPYEMGIVFGF